VTKKGTVEVDEKLGLKFMSTSFLSFLSHTGMNSAASLRPACPLSPLEGSSLPGARTRLVTFKAIKRPYPTELQI
jgi:hypothetical protein